MNGSNIITYSDICSNKCYLTVFIDVLKLTL